MVVILYIITISIFFLTLHFVRAVDAAKEIVHVGRDSISVVLDESLDDLQKEAAVRRLAGRMLKGWLVVSFKTAICLAFVGIPLFLLDSLGWVRFSEFSQFSLRADVLILTSVIGLAMMYALHKLKS